jgi:hypothetical protein
MGDTEDMMKEIQDIMQPEKFIQKCFGEIAFEDNDSRGQVDSARSPPRFLFDEIIKKVPTPPRSRKRPSSQSASRKSLHKSPSA